MDAEQVLVEKLERIHNKNRNHNLDEIIDMCKAHKEYFHRVIKERKLFPYCEQALDFFSAVTDFTERVFTARRQPRIKSVETVIRTSIETIGGYCFTYTVSEKSMVETMKRFMRFLSDIVTEEIGFENLAKDIYANVNIEVLPDDIFEDKKILLPQGRIIVRPYANSGFDVYNISARQCKEHSYHILLDKLNYRQFESLEKALSDDYYIPKNIVGRTTVAKNDKDFPFEESFLTMLHIKYEDLMKRSHRYKQ